MIKNTLNSRLFSFVFLSVFLTVSCTTTHKETSSQTHSGMTVDWEGKESKAVPQIKSEATPGVGPLPQSPLTISESKQNSKTKKKISALVAGAGGYRSLGLIDLLKKMEKRGETPFVIVGHGFSAIILSYLSLGYKPDYIEWKFFKFFKELDDESIFSREWILKLRNYLAEELKGQRIEDGKFTLFIPLWNEEEQKVTYKKRGLLLDALISNVDPQNLLKLPHKPAYTHSFLPKEAFDELGVNNIYAVDFVSSGLKWKKANGFLNGTFQKISSLQLNEKRRYSIENYIQFPFGELELDNNKKLPEIIYQGKKFVEELDSLFEKDKEVTL